MVLDIRVHPALSRPKIAVIAHWRPARANGKFMLVTDGPDAREANPQPGTRVTISYCTQCKWLLRAAWMAQELLSTFETELAEVALRPAIGGLFRIEVDGNLVWDRARDGGFPDVKTLKRLIRDKAAPGRALGHVDRD